MTHANWYTETTCLPKETTTTEQPTTTTEQQTTTTQEQPTTTAILATTSTSEPVTTSTHDPVTTTVIPIVAAASTLAAGNQLPQTGIDAGPLAMIGVLCVVIGVAMRKRLALR